MSGPFILAFGVWMLLTADFSWVNLIVGALAALLVSFLPIHKFSAWQLVRLIVAVLLRLPMALWESFRMVVGSYPNESSSSVDVEQPENKWAVFCQTFIITFTPRSLVISEEVDEKVDIHSLEGKKPS